MKAYIEILRKIPGLDILGFDDGFLVKSIEKCSKARACESNAIYVGRLKTDRTEAEIFVRSLRVSYSEFFRNPLAFALLEQVVLPSLIESVRKSQRGELRVWSAGCATGQEAWSMAILLDEMTRPPDPPISCRILATDVSEDDLETARAGSYSTEAVGNVRARQLHEFFSQQGSMYAIASSQLRDRVAFSVFDLLDPQSRSPAASIYGGFDLILCCNVLLYYRPAAQGFILDKLRRCLAPSGYLVVGETERSIVESAGGFRAVAPPATVFQQVR
jgi:chemotaxis methyl-accepting protein methylase